MTVPAFGLRLKAYLFPLRPVPRRWRKRMGAATVPPIISAAVSVFFPVDDPQVILYMAVIRPVGETYGSLVAAPAISEAANAIIDYRGMGRANAPNITHTGIIKSHRQTPVTVGDTMPDLLGTPETAAARFIRQNRYYG